MNVNGTEVLFGVDEERTYRAYIDLLRRKQLVTQIMSFTSKLRKPKTTTRPIRLLRVLSATAGNPKNI